MVKHAEIINDLKVNSIRYFKYNDLSKVMPENIIKNVLK